MRASIVEKHTFDFPNLEETIQEISDKFNLGPRQIYVYDIDIGNIEDAGIVIDIDGRLFYIVLDTMKEELARLDVLEDPSYYLIGLNSSEINALIDITLLKTLISDKPDADKLLSELEWKEPYMFMKQDLGLSEGNTLNEFIVENLLICPQELAVYLVDTYGVSSVLSGQDKEYELESNPGFVYFLYS